MGCDILTSESCQNQLSIFSELKKFKEYLSNFNYESVIDDLVNQKTFIYGNPAPTDQFKTLSGIEEFVRQLKERVDNIINGNGSEIDWESINNPETEGENPTNIIDTLIRINNRLNQIERNYIRSIIVNGETLEIIYGN